MSMLQPYNLQEINIKFINLFFLKVITPTEIPEHSSE